MTRTIRCTLTFTFDDRHITEAAIKDDLDHVLCETFPLPVDVHTRWVSQVREAPLFGAGIRLRDELATDRRREREQA
jgi:hypothetical protein